MAAAPDERGLARLFRRVDRSLFRRRREGGKTETVALPLAGRKLSVDLDWSGHS